MPLGAAFEPWRKPFGPSRGPLKAVRVCFGAGLGAFLGRYWAPWLIRGAAEIEPPPAPRLPLGPLLGRYLGRLGGFWDPSLGSVGSFRGHLEPSDVHRKRKSEKATTYGFSSFGAIMTSSGGYSRARKAFEIVSGPSWGLSGVRRRLTFAIPSHLEPSWR